MAEEPPYVLIVDDERVIADTLHLILESQSHASRSFYSGEEALRYATEHPPLMLISDVIMAGMTGFDLAIQLKKIVPGCTVLLISGQVATERLLEQAKQAGHSFDLLAKPVHPVEILERVKRVFASASRTS
jgi:DNA-binding NtrC family response regulator